MKSHKLPLDKNDLRYDPVRKEVSLPREKFDGMIQFVRDLLEENEHLENARDTAIARRSRSEVKANVLSAYADVMQEANRIIQTWVNENTIQELSRRTKIPYATCHRIVRERLENAQVDVGTVEKMLRVAQPEVDRSEGMSR